MINENDLKKQVGLIKNGNSYAFRITKKDREIMSADSNTKFEKIISPDGKEVTFKQVTDLDDEVSKIVGELIKENKNVLKRLEDL